jgi:PHD-finger
MPPKSNPAQKSSCEKCDRLDDAEDMVQCEDCDHWFHYSCAGFNPSAEDNEWICRTCLEERKKKEQRLAADDARKKEGEDEVSPKGYQDYLLQKLETSQSLTKELMNENERLQAERVAESQNLPSFR